MADPVNSISAKKGSAGDENAVPDLSRTAFIADRLRRLHGRTEGRIVLQHLPPDGRQVDTGRTIRITAFMEKFHGECDHGAVYTPPTWHAFVFFQPFTLACCAQKKGGP